MSTTIAQKQSHPLRAHRSRMKRSPFDQIGITAAERTRIRISHTALPVRIVGIIELDLG